MRGWQTHHRKDTACPCEEEQRRPAQRVSPERTHLKTDRNSEDRENASSSLDWAAERKDDEEAACHNSVTQKPVDLVFCGLLSGTLSSSSSSLSSSLSSLRLQSYST